MNIIDNKSFMKAVFLQFLINKNARPEFKENLKEHGFKCKGIEELVEEYNPKSFIDSFDWEDSNDPLYWENLDAEWRQIVDDDGRLHVLYQKSQSSIEEKFLQLLEEENAIFTFEQNIKAKGYYPKTFFRETEPKRWIFQAFDWNNAVRNIDRAVLQDKWLDLLIDIEDMKPAIYSSETEHLSYSKGSNLNKLLKL